MKITEFANYCNVTPRSLRHYEKLGLIAPGRTSNGYRKYQKSQAEVVKQIQWLLKARLSLKKIKYIVPCTIQETKILMCKDLKNLFEDEIKRLEEEIEALAKSKIILVKTLRNSILVKDD
jgi:DNA-binding transcriptional MerR regulator